MQKTRKILTMSFDDGTVQDVRLIEMFNRYGIKATFNLNSGLLGNRHHIVHEGIDCDHTEVRAASVRTLYAGHEIASHTVNHPCLLGQSKTEIIHQVEDDASALEALCGYPIIGLAYPGGPYDQKVVQTIRQHTRIRYARTVYCQPTFALPTNLLEWHPTCCINDDSLFDLAERFLQAEPEQQMLFYIWGHSFEFDKFHSWGRLDCFLKEISGRPEIAYVTNRQALEMCGLLEKGANDPNSAHNASSTKGAVS